MKNLAWKQILITFAVSFVLGAVFGRFEFSQTMHHRWKDPEARQKWVLKKMDAKLDLSSEQKEKITFILREMRPQWEAARAEMKPKFEVLRQQMREKVTPFLTSDQLGKYDEMEEEWRKRR